ncbi:hypothetical protein E2562_015807 [Oryza meyeriana var. granulata]|uniref:Uncharacterized protein n=1 Tax=Oryza meyeriana var. granulata TaxID=110450 RepID=A0A6G1D4F8_9ORYZ|nr:hypothetical protein E2562_015807 [Oryza meyeriana var. granulata]
MKKKTLHSVLPAIFLLHLLLTAVPAVASPTTGGSLHDGNNNAVAVAAARTRSSRRLLLQQQPRAAAMATNTFRVKGVHQAPENGKPKVEFDASMKPKPGSRFNPKQN